MHDPPLLHAAAPAANTDDGRLFGAFGRPSTAEGVGADGNHVILSDTPGSSKGSVTGHHRLVPSRTPLSHPKLTLPDHKTRALLTSSPATSWAVVLPLAGGFPALISPLALARHPPYGGRQPLDVQATAKH
jgi:hypothetical protein